MTKSKVAYWVFAVVLALAFVAAGFMKLSSSATSVEMFSHFGYSMAFMYFIGACEFIGGVGLILGRFVNARLSRLAAMGLLVIMLGAIGTHIIYDPLLAMIPAVTLAILLIGFLYLDKKQGVAVPLA